MIARGIKMRMNLTKKRIRRKDERHIFKSKDLLK